MSSSSLHDDRGPALSVYNAVMIAIPTVAVFIRFWSRALTDSEKHGRFWWDDWTALAALPFCVSSNSLAIKLTQLGVGRHIKTLPPSDILQVLKTLFASYLVYDTGLSIAKSSALLFYARIFGTHNKMFLSALWITQGLVWAWWAGIMFGTIFMCNPVQKNWITDAPGHCGSTGSLWLGSAIPSVIIDLIILLLPMPMLWGLHLKPSRRLLICGIFVCGYCVILVSLGRLITVITSEAQLNEDLTWAGVNALYWLGAETPLTIMSICLPSVFFLFRRAQQHGLSALCSTRVGSSRARLQPYEVDYSPDNTGNASSHVELRKPSRGSTSSQERLYNSALVQAKGAGVEISANHEYSIEPDVPEVQRPTPGIHVSSEFRVSRE